MGLIPRKNIEFQSALPLEVLLERIDAILEPHKFLRLQILGIPLYTKNKPYLGKRNTHEFNCSRVLYYKNSFQPVIHGRVSQLNEGTLIKINFSIHLAVRVFLIIFLSLGTLVACIMIGAMTVFNSFTPVFLLPLGFCIFALLITHLGFHSETRISKKFLVKLFEGFNVKED